MPRLRAARTQEDIGKAPPDEPLDIELEAAPAEVEVAEPLEAGPNEKAESRWVAAEGSEVEEPKPELKQEPEVDLRKRLADAERAEAENTRLRQERADLERQLQEAQRAQSRSQDERNDAYYAGLLNAKDAAQAQVLNARHAVRAARAAGDEDAEDAAWGERTRAELAISRYDEQIGEYEEIRKQPKVEVQQPQQPQGLEAVIAQYPEEAKQRFRAHPEYVTVPRMTAKLVAAHWDAIEEGHAQYSPGYFKYLDDKVFEPTKLTVVEGEQRPYTIVAPEQREQLRRGVVASAPPTREVPLASTGKPQSTRVTLSAEERDIARASKSKYQTVAEAELEYARQKIKYQEAKRAGQYQERG